MKKSMFRTSFHLAKRKIITVAILTFSFYSVAFAQENIPLGPGPVISISPGENNTPPTIQQNNIPPTSPQMPPTTPPPAQLPPNGPGPAMAPPGWGYNGFLNPQLNPATVNQGTINVMGTGYDSQGVMKQIPMFVSYNYNGVNYDVMVLNAWNPYTQQWDANVDEPAYSTQYYFNGFTYNFYTVLSTGTFYFNL